MVLDSQWYQLSTWANFVGLNEQTGLTNTVSEWNSFACREFVFGWGERNKT